jgi:uncharacterized protein
VICHAHPKHGGSKDHPVLWALRNELAHRGLAVIGFNFRGVMGSEGSWGGGGDEVHDVRAAIGRVSEAAPSVPTFLCGWSFGAAVAIREALEDDRVGAVALVAPPLEPGDVEIPALPAAHELRAFAKPVLLLAGQDDVYCPAAQLRAFAGRFPVADTVIIPGCDHFFTRHEKQAATVVGAFLDRVLGSVPP